MIEQIVWAVGMGVVFLYNEYRHGKRREEEREWGAMGGAMDVFHIVDRALSEEINRGEGGMIDGRAFRTRVTELCRARLKGRL